jgi:hypothetical protein
LIYSFRFTSAKIGVSSRQKKGTHKKNAKRLNNLLAGTDQTNVKTKYKRLAEAKPAKADQFSNSTKKLPHVVILMESMIV